MEVTSVIMLLVLTAGGINLCNAACDDTPVTGDCLTGDGVCVDDTCWCDADQGGEKCLTTCAGPSCTAGTTVCTGTAAVVTCVACPTGAAACTPNGVCASTAGSATPVCRCNAGYTGSKCETEQCDGTKVCQNGGTCGGDDLCDCAPGYTGDLCDEDINDCASDPCENGGTCADGVNSYTCTCATDYTGVNCESGAVVLSSSFLLTLVAYFVISV